MELPCARCKKPVYFEAAKCPYCTVVQPKKTHDPARARRLTLAAGLAGAAAGLLWGFASGPATLRVAGIPMEEAEANRKRADEAYAAVKDRYKAERSRLKAEGFVLVEPAALAVSPARYEGKRVAIAGFVAHARVGRTESVLLLGTHWAGGRSFEVDMTALPVETKARLLKARAAPHAAILSGAWTRMPAKLAGINSVPGFGLEASEASVLGAMPANAFVGIDDLDR